MLLGFGALWLAVIFWMANHSAPNQHSIILFGKFSLIGVIDAFIFSKTICKGQIWLKFGQWTKMKPEMTTGWPFINTLLIQWQPLGLCWWSFMSQKFIGQKIWHSAMTRLRQDQDYWGKNDSYEAVFLLLWKCLTSCHFPCMTNRRFIYEKEWFILSYFKVVFCFSNKVVRSVK